MPTSPESQPLRCHLLIGPPASGKSTLAGVLAELTGATVLNTDNLRAELFGDASTQGSWDAIEQLLHQRLRNAVAAGSPVILDATHCQRPWRLAITQALELPAPVQWIGWWLTTPLEQCLEWNQQRERQVDPAVITRMHGDLPSLAYAPPARVAERLNSNPEQLARKQRQLRQTFLDRQRNGLREEGFADVVMIEPAAIGELDGQCCSALQQIDPNIAYAAKRRERFRLHRYSRLLDLERLIHLIRLLLEFPGLTFTGAQVADNREGSISLEAQALQSSFRYRVSDPLPSEDAPFASRAAFVLAHRHGPCYGDAVAVEADLAWLERQGFVAVDPVVTAIEPGPPTPEVLQAMATGAGFPAAADRQVFQRQLALLRHLIQNPFDRSPSQAELEQELMGGNSGRRGRRRFLADRSRNTATGACLGPAVTSPPGRARLRSPGVREHLLQRLEAIAGVSYDGQVRRLDKDIEQLLTPYGFRNPLPMADSDIPSSKTTSSRRGIALGTALLTATQLKEVHMLIQQSYRNLKDPTLLALQQDLEDRLSMAGVAVESLVPVRGIANRSIIDPQQLHAKSLALPSQMERVEEAILERRKIRVRLVPSSPERPEVHSSATSPQGRQTEDQSVLVWPLQILFHNIAWYLAYESDGVREHGLLTITRLDRLQLIDVLREQRPATKARESQERLGHLTRRSGGIYLGGNVEHQIKVGVETLSLKELRGLQQEGAFQCVRLRCNAAIYKVFCEGNNRYPSEQMRLSFKPDPDPACTHPYTVELILPSWTVNQERDFRRWLFGFGTQIRIEAPQALRDDHRAFGAGIASLYESP